MTHRVTVVDHPGMVRRELVCLCGWQAWVFADEATDRAAFHIEQHGGRL